MYCLEEIIDKYRKEQVAYTLDDITEDTICFVVDLTIDMILPTYNLKYVYGNLDYRFYKVYNLENLEMIFGRGQFKKLIHADDLENLKYIGGTANFSLLRSSKGLHSLEKINGSALFENLEDAKGLEKLEYIYLDAYFPSLESALGLENLKYIGGLHSFGSEGVSFKKFKEREKMKCLKK